MCKGLDEIKRQNNQQVIKVVIKRELKDPIPDWNNWLNPGFGKKT